jgi:Family of unknown function (DUF6504)
MGRSGPLCPAVSWAEGSAQWGAGPGDMTKRYDEEIEVTATPWDGGAPAAFRWRGRLYDVDQSLATWREAGEWWSEQDVRDRTYHRVLAHPAGVLATGQLDSEGFMLSPAAVYDVYLDRARGSWRLARVWD